MTRTHRIAIAGLATLSLGWLAWAQDAGSNGTPTTQGTYDRLLGTERDSVERPLQPTRSNTIDTSTGANAVAPSAPQLPTRREGSFIIDRVGRLSSSPNRQGWEFVFDADGMALRDPPMEVLPNLKLMVMEEAIENGGSDLRFRVSGTLTEYRGRNYVLLDKVVVVQR